MKRVGKFMVFIMCAFLMVSCTTAMILEDKTTAPSPIQRTHEEKGLLTLRFFGIHELGIKNGESTLIITPGGKTLLVDAGYDRDHDLVSSLIKDTGTSHLDYVIYSHFHSDHTGDFDRLSEDFTIGSVLLINFSFPQGKSASIRESILSKAEEKKIPYHYIQRGDRIELDEGLSLDFLNPISPITYDASVVDDRTQSIFENNHSMVFLLTYGDNSFLFTGDIYKETEYMLIDQYGERLKSDLLKVPHHGLSTSSSSLFLLSVDPQVNIVSSGEPTQSTLDSLRYHARTLTTVAYGTILVTSDGRELNIVVEHEDRTNGVYGQ